MSQATRESHVCRFAAATALCIITAWLVRGVLRSLWRGLAGGMQLRALGAHLGATCPFRLAVVQVFQQDVWWARPWAFKRFDDREGRSLGDTKVPRARVGGPEVFRRQNELLKVVAVLFKQTFKSLAGDGCLKSDHVFDQERLRGFFHGCDSALHYSELGDRVVLCRQITQCCAAAGARRVVVGLTEPAGRRSFLLGHLLHPFSVLGVCMAGRVVLASTDRLRTRPAEIREVARCYSAERQLFTGHCCHRPA